MLILIEFIIITLILGAIFINLKTKFGYEIANGIFINGIDKLLSGIDVKIDFNPKRILINDFLIPIERIKGFEKISIANLNNEQQKILKNKQYEPNIISIHYLNQQQENKICYFALKDNRDLSTTFNKLNSIIGYIPTQEKYIEI